MWKAPLILLLIVGSVHAGEIRGRVQFHRPASGEVRISYEGLTKEGNRISNMAGLTVGPGESWVWCDNECPQANRREVESRQGIHL